MTQKNPGDRNALASRLPRPIDSFSSDLYTRYMSRSACSCASLSAIYESCRAELRATTDFSVSQFCHADECLFYIVIGASCEMVSGRFGAKENGDNQQYQAGYHGRRVDKAQCRSV